MIRAFWLSVEQIPDRAVLAVLGWTLLLTAAIFAVAGVALWYGIDAFVAWAQLSWLDGGEAVIAAILMVILGWLLFRATAIAIMGVFADGVVEAVERKHYPQALATCTPPSWAVSLRLALGSVLRALFFNLLALPVYLVLLVTGIGTIVAVIAVNAPLLGRDLGEMVAIRHMDRTAMRAWRATTRGQRLLLGLVGSCLFMVPVLNLFAPIIGAAMATHMFHKGRAKTAANVEPVSLEKESDT